MAKKTKELHCDFCGKDRSDVEKLIAGANVNICNECVKLCDQILEDQTEKESKPKLTSVSQPTQDQKVFG